MLLRAAHETDLSNTFQIFQKCAGNSLLGQSFRLFTARPHFDVSRPGVAQAVSARHGWLLLIIDVLNVNLRREIRVAVEDALGLSKAAGFIDVSYGRVLLQILDDLLSLLRQREP